MTRNKQLFKLCVFLILFGIGIIGCNSDSSQNLAFAAPSISQEQNQVTEPPTTIPTSLPQKLVPSATPTQATEPPPATPTLLPPTLTPTAILTYEPTPLEPTSVTSNPEETPIPDSVTFDVEQSFTISNKGPSALSTLRLTVAKIQSLDPFQEVLSFKIDPPLEFKVKSDEFNNQLIEFQLFNLEPNEIRQFTLKYEVVAYSQKSDTLECEGELITGFTQEEKYIESNAEGIVALSQQLSKGTTDVCQQVRAFYDYVAENVEYHPVHSLEDYGALKALEYKSGDCTEFSDLLIALSRSAGIPARFVEGLVPIPGDEKHDWAQVYLPGSGWVTMEPTWGRHEELREIYFAGTTPDHIIVSTGRNLKSLNNKHYWSSRFWWDNTLSQPLVKIKSDWEIIPKK